jgi:serine/threonine protein kinase
VQYFGLYISQQKEKYIVTEFLSLGSLENLLRVDGSKLEYSDMISMYATDYVCSLPSYRARDAASGMNYLHEQHIIHRDLSARNLLVTYSSNQQAKYTVKVAGNKC